MRIAEEQVNYVWYGGGGIRGGMCNVRTAQWQAYIVGIDTVNLSNIQCNNFPYWCALVQVSFIHM